MCQVIHEDLYKFKPEVVKHYNSASQTITEIHMLEAYDKSHALCVELDRNSSNQNTRPDIMATYQLNQGQKEGWCVSYHHGVKSAEGWYTNGKKQGIHRSYGRYLSNHTPTRQSYFLNGECHYLDDVMFHATKYEPGGAMTMDYNVVDNQIHGLVKLGRVGVVQLIIHGKLIMNDVEDELKIDVDNLTEIDIFTLEMLGL